MESALQHRGPLHAGERRAAILIRRAFFSNF